MKSRTKQILQVMHVISWIIFIGLCFKTGTILFSFIVSLFMNAEATKKLYMTLNLSALREFDMVYYVILGTLIIFISGLKAFIFYQVIKIFSKMNLKEPFSTEVSLLISNIGYVALGIGVITGIADGQYNWLVKQGVTFPDMQAFLGGAAEFLLLGGTIFIIAQVFKRGIELQSENELTV